MGWWLWLLPATGGSSYGSGVSHIHNPGAVCEAEGGRSQFYGAIFEGAANFYSEYPGAIFPEIAGRNEKVGGEPFRRLPEGIACIGGGAHPNNSGAAALAVPISLFHGAIFPEIAGRNEKLGGEPFRRLPEGIAAIGNIAYVHNEGSVCEAEGGKSQFYGAIFPEIAGRNEKLGGEPFRRLPEGNVNVA